MKKLLLLSLFMLVHGLLMAGKEDNTDSREKFQTNIYKTSLPITIDGKVDEEAWLNSEIINNFINKWPLDSGLADAQTEVRLTYDDDFLYVSAICYGYGDGYIIQSLKRDNDDSHWQSDAFTLLLDPINERTNGFMFGVNAGGAQIEAQLTVPGNRTRYDENWDNKWYSEVSMHKDYWVVEMAIPFKTLRFNSSDRSWGVNFLRNDMGKNEYSTWSRVPQGFPGIDLAYNGQLNWDQPPKQTKGRVALIPYTAGGVSRNHEDGEDTKSDFEVGLDAKVQLTSSLNLDLTLNPDFSNVDVDQQVTNLSRFSIFFPERRNFFLENSDLFANFGTWNVRPFFSRRIGIHEGEAVPIIFGARVSGNLNNNLRIGIMDVHTKEVDELASQNYFVSAVQYRVLKRSSIKGIFVNRQAMDDIMIDGSLEEKDYNRNAGLEFQYVSRNSRLNANVKAHTAMTPDKFDDRSFYNISGSYSGKNLYGGLEMDRVGENYTADVGFTPRLENYDAERDTTVRIGYYNINPWIGYNFRPKDTKINQHGPSTWTVLNYTVDGEFNERRTTVAYDIAFQNKSFFFFRVQNADVKLPFPTELLGDDFAPLPAERYQFTDAFMNYDSDPRKTFSFGVSSGYGSFYTGTRIRFSTRINYRIQPWANFTMEYTQNRVDLGGEFGEDVLHLVGPKAEISFNNKMFWTTFMQFNTQAENFNINSRFQWRYRPMSDIFIVYSDNYTTTNLETKNRGVVFKVTYWLNM